MDFIRIKIFCGFLMLLFSLAPVGAEENQARGETAPKTLSGMSIVGNDDAPKALYIVPWKSSELGIETAPDMPARRGYAPVDRDEFRRKLDYYYVSTKNDTGR